MKNIVLLGSTGSIGTQTLDVVRSYKEDLHVVALAAGSSVEKMEQQIREFSPSYAVMWSEEAAKDLKQRVSDLQVQVLTGMDGTHRDRGNDRNPTDDRSDRGRQGYCTCQ